MNLGIASAWLAMSLTTVLLGLLTVLLFHRGRW